MREPCRTTEPTNSTVTKQNASTWTLGGPNTYTGTTTVNGGTLHLTGSLAAGSAVTVGGDTATGTPTLTGAGGTVNGTLTIAAAGVGAAGTVNPGTVGTTGTLNAGATTIAGTYACDVVAATADVLAVTGNLTSPAATFTLNAVTPTARQLHHRHLHRHPHRPFTQAPPCLGYMLDYAPPTDQTGSNTATPYDTWGSTLRPHRRQRRPPIRTTTASPTSRNSPSASSRTAAPRSIPITVQLARPPASSPINA